MYPPLSSWIGHYNMSVDLVIFALHLARASSIIRALNFIITILYFRNPRKRYYNTPLFLFAILTTAFLLLISLPVLAARITILLFDRNLRCSFFDPSRRGDPILFEHLFWFFRHPEVYVLILPRFRIASQVVRFFASSSSTFGYYRMSWSIIAIGFIGCIVWAHHCYTTGIDLDTRCYFSAASLVIRVPTRVKVFTWIFTLMFSEVVVMNRILIWIRRFIFLFSLRRATRILLAHASIDLVLHDTYFVIAHFHYVLSISAVFSLFIRFYQWWPLITRHNMELALNSSQFSMNIWRVNIIFLPIHATRVANIHRRYATYDDVLTRLNHLSTLRLCAAILRSTIIIRAILSSTYTPVLGIGFQEFFSIEYTHGPRLLHTFIEAPLIVNKG